MSKSKFKRYKLKSLTITFIILHFFLLILFLLISESYYVVNSSLKFIRILIITLFIFFSITSIPILLKVRLKKSNFNEKLPQDSIKIGFLVLNLSHHDNHLFKHELKIKDHYICTGCTGNAIGLIIGIIIGIIHLLSLGESSKILGYSHILVGLILISLSLSKYIRSIYGFFRLIFNSMLPIGLWLIIVGSDIMSKNISTYIYWGLLIPILIFQRLFSQDWIMNYMTNVYIQVN